MHDDSWVARNELLPRQPRMKWFSSSVLAVSLTESITCDLTPIGSPSNKMVTCIEASMRYIVDRIGTVKG